MRDGPAADEMATDCCFMTESSSVLQSDTSEVDLEVCVLTSRSK